MAIPKAPGDGLISSAPASGRIRLALALASLLALLALAPFLWPRKHQQPAPTVPPIELLRSESDLIDGRLCRRGETSPFTGILVERYPNGSVQSRSSVVLGLLDGLSEGWHTNGQVQIREFFARGVAAGPRTKWYPDGATQSVASIADGRLDGQFLRWHENGQLAEQVQLRQGEPEGLSYAYYPSGRLKAQVLIRDGKVIEKKYWPDSEQPAASEGSSPAQ